MRLKRTDAWVARLWFRAMVLSHACAPVKSRRARYRMTQTKHKNKVCLNKKARVAFRQRALFSCNLENKSLSLRIKYATLAAKVQGVVVQTSSDSSLLSSGNCT